MTGPNVNRDAVAGFFAAVADKDASWGSHGLPRASSIGNDLLQQYFTLLYGLKDRDDFVFPDWVDTLQFFPSERTGEEMWRNDEGKWMEPQVYEILRKQGYLIHDVQTGAVRYAWKGDLDNIHTYICSDDSMGLSIHRLREDGHLPFLSMHIDGIMEEGPDQLPPTLLELKRLTMYSFSGITQEGIRKEKMTYYAQAQTAMRAFGLNSARIYVFSRDPSAVKWHFTVQRSKNPIFESPSLYVEDIPVDDVMGRFAEARALHLVECLERRTPPVTDPGVSILTVKVDKNGDMHHTFPCGWCDFREPCIQYHQKVLGVNVNAFQIVDDARLKKDQSNAPNPPARRADRPQDLPAPVGA